MNMNTALKAKYTTYNGDTQHGSEWKANGTQYGMGRAGNGNGKRPSPLKVTDAFKASCAADSVARATAPKTLVVDGLTGHRVMVAL